MKILDNNYYKNMAFINAIKEGDEISVSKFIEEGIDVNQKDEHGITPLISALVAKKYNIAFLLIKNEHINVGYTNFSNSSYSNALTIAYDQLNSNGRDVRKKLKSLIDIINKKLEITPVQKLEENEVKILSKKFMNYILFYDNHNPKKYTDLTKDILRYYVPANNQFYNDEYIFSPIVKYGHEKILELLLEKCTNVDFEQRSVNAFMEASKYGKKNIVELLLNKNKFLTKSNFNNKMMKDLSGHRLDTLDIYDVNNARINPDTVNLDKETALMLAAKNDRPQIVELLLSKGANLDMQNKNGDTALMLALHNNRLDVTKTLLDKNANLDIQNNNGETAIMLAVKDGNQEIIELLLSKGADPKIKNNNGEEAIIVAAKLGYENILKTLLNSSANEEQIDHYVNKVLIFAVKHGNKNIVQMLLNENFDINLENLDGETALIVALQNGQLELAEFLLNNTDISVNYTKFSDSSYSTPITIAYDKLNSGKLNNVEKLKSIIDIINQKLEFVPYKKLKKNEVEILIKKLKNYIESYDKKSLGYVKDILMHNQLINCKLQSLEEDYTPLMFVAQNGMVEIAKLLISKSADIDIQNKHGITAMMFAAQKARKEIVELLLEKSDINIANEKGETALMLAVKNGNQEIINLLLNKDANPNIANEKGETALMLAAKNEETEIINLLLNKDANPNIANEKGETALTFAIKNGNFGSVKAILDNNYLDIETIKSAKETLKNFSGNQKKKNKLKNIMSEKIKSSKGSESKKSVIDHILTSLKYTVVTIFIFIKKHVQKFFKSKNLNFSNKNNEINDNIEFENNDLIKDNLIMNKIEKKLKSDSPSNSVNSTETKYTNSVSKKSEKYILQKRVR